MTDGKALPRRPRAAMRRAGGVFFIATLAACLIALTLAACGGGGSPLGNPASVANPQTVGGQKLAFAYFQRCINPILLKQRQVVQNGVASNISCAGSGCHSNANGTGGALRVEPGAQLVDLASPASTADVIRASDMYKNFYSSQGSTIIGNPAESRMLNKPLVQGVLHGGGVVFDKVQDSAEIKLLEYWIGRPAPQGQDEFSTATYSMFTPADPATGMCNTQ